jgi:cytochrome c oxidase subunit 2
MGPRPVNPTEREGALSLAGNGKRKRELMKFGELARTAGLLMKAAGLSLALVAATGPALAAAPAAEAPAAQAATAPVAKATPAAADAAPAAATEAKAPAFPRMKPTPGKGMPVDSGIGLQTQFSPLGHYGRWIHDAVLLPIIVIITIFVLILLLWVMGRYNRRSNPVASRTSHNTVIEVIWTLVPVLILVGIAIPSIDLLAKQYKPAPAKALTVKVTGNQWFWTYGYPDNGEFEVNSYMLNIPGAPVVNSGVRDVGTDPSDGPSHLEVDNRMVLPVGEPIRLQVTASDVIHSFAIPSLWFKIDAVPGRINERVLFINEPGVYYGQCSELCGVKHGYMPIAIEALPREQYNAWVLTQSGGKVDGQPAVAAPAAAASPAAPAPAAVPASPAAAPAPAAPASPAPAA